MLIDQLYRIPKGRDFKSNIIYFNLGSLHHRQNRLADLLSTPCGARHGVGLTVLFSSCLGYHKHALVIVYFQPSLMNNSILDFRIKHYCTEQPGRTKSAPYVLTNASFSFSFCRFLTSIGKYFCKKSIASKLMFLPSARITVS
jgi:hypothetical protein